LTAALHSVALLKAEIAREERQLNNSQDHLTQLERNAESERKFWARQAKKVFIPLITELILTILTDASIAGL
jgi:hypothetical protein